MTSTANGHEPTSRTGAEFRIVDIKHCPLCSAPIGSRTSGLLQEYWVAEDRYFDLWCSACQRHITLVLAERVTTREPGGDPHDHP